MKHVFLILVGTLVSLSVMAQEKTKQKEVGLSFSDFNSFGLIYRVGSQKSLWRFNVSVGGGNFEDKGDSLYNQRNNIRIDMGIGKEYRTQIAESLEFRYGADVGFGYLYHKRDNDEKTINDRDSFNKQKQYIAKLNFILGCNYVFNNHFVIGVEVMPNISYRAGENTNSYSESETITKTRGFNYGVSNNSALLTLLYRF